MRVLLGDRSGRVHGELVNGNISNISWRLNSTGSSTLKIKVWRDNSLFKKELLSSGSRVYVEFDNGLPAWGGVMDLPRRWTEGELEIRVHTIERILSYIITKKTRGFYGAVVGHIFGEVLREAELREQLGLELGHIWYGGLPHWPRYHFRDAMWIINNSIRKMENCDYHFVPYLDDGRIKFRAELHEFFGADKRDSVLLAEGNNIVKATLVEQGNIVNRVAVVGTGSTWGERDVVYGEEHNSIRKYGLRERMLQPSGVSQIATLRRHADVGLRENAFPHTIVGLEVSDNLPSKFEDYGIGDIISINLVNYGFEGFSAPMRILARGYDPGTGSCELVCDERFEYSISTYEDDATEFDEEEE